MSASRIAITLGDPAGVGPEVVIKSLYRRTKKPGEQILIVGHETILTAECGRLRIKPFWKLVKAGEPLFGKGINLLEPCAPTGKTPAPGKWNRLTGKLSLEYVETAIGLCLKSEADAVVTAPICKAAWKAAGAPWPGHTELFAERTGTSDFVMMLSGGGLNVALVTIHEPLARVPKLVTSAKIVSTVTVVDLELKNSFGLEKPRIAILGLNPHAGEGGHIGHEEERVIIPAIKKLRRRKIDAIGPLPADTSFHRALNGDFDAIIAMYHDQGLGPLKTVAFDSGVNITLGLPIVRTSVDHGTAFDIAGKGKANPESCTAAIDTASKMITMRKRQTE